MSALDKARAALAALEQEITQSPFAEEDAVVGYSLIAIAEELRIASLLTVAIDRQSPVGSPVFNADAREKARDEALGAMGLPTGPWVSRR